jgi:flagellar hook-associated protein 3 FlgL
MDFTISAAARQYLNGLNQTQAQINQATSQVSSGLKIQQPSDNPGTIADILQLQSTIAQNTQVQSNLSSESSELGTADSALQSAIQAVQKAITVGEQGASSTVSADTQSQLAAQVAGIQQALVGISATTVNGRYIFSGDNPAQAPYQLDPSAPEGVTQLVTAGSTRMIEDASGTGIAVAKTAAEIFDPQNSDGTPANGNTFAAVNSLLTALQNGDTAGVSTAVASLQTAYSYLNNQLTFYGEAETQVSTASSLAQQFQLQEKSNLSSLQDANLPAAAEELSQAQTQQQAELSIAAKIEQARNLFDILG